MGRFLWQNWKLLLLRPGFIEHVVNMKSHIDHKDCRICEEFCCDVHSLLLSSRQVQDSLQWNVHLYKQVYFARQHNIRCSFCVGAVSKMIPECAPQKAKPRLQPVWSQVHLNPAKPLFRLSVFWHFMKTGEISKQYANLDWFLWPTTFVTGHCVQMFVWLWVWSKNDHTHTRAPFLSLHTPALEMFSCHQTYSSSCISASWMLP